MEIKTIYAIMNCSQKFDDDVNEALKQGWRLKRREIIPEYDLGPLLYAELEFPDNAIEICEETRQMIESCRGTSSPSDYVNTALLLGIEAMERIKMSMAADDIEDGAAPDAEEEDDD